MKNILRKSGTAFLGIALLTQSFAPGIIYAADQILTAPSPAFVENPTQPDTSELLNLKLLGTNKDLNRKTFVKQYLSLNEDVVGGFIVSIGRNVELKNSLEAEKLKFELFQEDADGTQVLLNSKILDGVKSLEPEEVSWLIPSGQEIDKTKKLFLKISVEGEVQDGVDFPYKLYGTNNAKTKPNFFENMIYYDGIEQTITNDVLNLTVLRKEQSDLDIPEKSDYVYTQMVSEDVWLLDASNFKVIYGNNFNPSTINNRCLNIGNTSGAGENPEYRSLTGLEVEKLFKYSRYLDVLLKDMPVASNKNYNLITSDYVYHFVGATKDSIITNRVYNTKDKVYNNPNGVNFAICVQKKNTNIVGDTVKTTQINSSEILLSGLELNTEKLLTKEDNNQKYIEVNANRNIYNSSTKNVSTPLDTKIKVSTGYVIKASGEISTKTGELTNADGVLNSNNEITSSLYYKIGENGVWKNAGMYKEIINESGNLYLAISDSDNNATNNTGKFKVIVEAPIVTSHIKNNILYSKVNKNISKYNIYLGKAGKEGLTYEETYNENEIPVSRPTMDGLDHLYEENLPNDFNGAEGRNIAFDGKYLYSISGNQMSKLGTGLNGSQKTLSKVTLPIDFGNNLKSIVYIGGYIYAGYSPSGLSNYITRINANTGAVETIKLENSSLLDVDLGDILGKKISKDNYLITTDGTFIYNISTNLGRNENIANSNNKDYGVTIRVFDPFNDFNLVKETIVYPEYNNNGEVKNKISYFIRGAFVDRNYIYLIQKDTATENSVVSVFDKGRLDFVNKFNLKQGFSNCSATSTSGINACPITGIYDYLNDRVLLRDGGDSKKIHFYSKKNSNIIMHDLGQIGKKMVLYYDFNTEKEIRDNVSGKLTSKQGELELVDGQVGKAVFFKNENSLLNTNRAFNVFFSPEEKLNQITIAGWVKLKDANSKGNIFREGGNNISFGVGSIFNTNTPNNEIYLQLKARRADDPNREENLNIGYAMTAEEKQKMIEGFVHVAVVADANKELTLYLDGVKKKTVPLPAKYNFSREATIDSFIGDNGFTGSIDELAIWSRALEEKEIKSIYTTIKPIRYFFLDQRFQENKFKVSYNYQLDYIDEVKSYIKKANGEKIDTDKKIESGYKLYNDKIEALISKKVVNLDGTQNKPEFNGGLFNLVRKDGNSSTVRKDNKGINTNILRINNQIRTFNYDNEAVFRLEGNKITIAGEKDAGLVVPTLSYQLDENSEFIKGTLTLRNEGKSVQNYNSLEIMYGLNGSYNFVDEQGRGKNDIGQNATKYVLVDDLDTDDGLVFASTGNFRIGVSAGSGNNVSFLLNNITLNALETRSFDFYVGSKKDTDNMESYYNKIVNSNGLFNKYTSILDVVNKTIKDKKVLLENEATSSGRTIAGRNNSDTGYNYPSNNISSEEYRDVRYIRVHGNGNSQNCGFHTVELQAIQYKTGENKALGKPVSGRVHSNGHYITDGNYSDSGRFADMGCGAAHFTVDLQESFKISNVLLWNYYADNRRYNNLRIEVSNDGNSWIEIHNSNFTGSYPETQKGRGFPMTTSIEHNDKKGTHFIFPGFNKKSNENGTSITNGSVHILPFENDTIVSVQKTNKISGAVVGEAEMLYLPKFGEKYTLSVEEKYTYEIISNKNVTVIMDSTYDDINKNGSQGDEDGGSYDVQVGKEILLYLPGNYYSKGSLFISHPYNKTVNVNVVDKTLNKLNYSFQLRENEPYKSLKNIGEGNVLYITADSPITVYYGKGTNPGFSQMVSPLSTKATVPTPGANGKKIVVSTEVSGREDNLKVNQINGNSLFEDTLNEGLTITKDTQTEWYNVESLWGNKISMGNFGKASNYRTNFYSDNKRNGIGNEYEIANVGNNKATVINAEENQNIALEIWKKREQLPDSAYQDIVTICPYHEQYSSASGTAIFHRLLPLVTVFININGTIYTSGAINYEGNTTQNFYKIDPAVFENKKISKIICNSLPKSTPTGNDYNMSVVNSGLINANYIDYSYGGVFDATLHNRKIYFLVKDSNEVFIHGGIVLKDNNTIHTIRSGFDNIFNLVKVRFNLNGERIKDIVLLNENEEKFFIITNTGLYISNKNIINLTDTFEGSRDGADLRIDVGWYSYGSPTYKTNYSYNALFPGKDIIVGDKTFFEQKVNNNFVIDTRYFSKILNEEIINIGVVRKDFRYGSYGDSRTGRTYTTFAGLPNFFINTKNGVYFLYKEKTLNDGVYFVNGERDRTATRDNSTPYVIKKANYLNREVTYISTKSSYYINAEYLEIKYKDGSNIGKINRENFTDIFYPAFFRINSNNGNNTGYKGVILDKNGILKTNINNLPGYGGYSYRLNKDGLYFSIDIHIENRNGIGNVFTENITKRGGFYFNKNLFGNNINKYINTSYPRCTTCYTSYIISAKDYSYNFSTGVYNIRYLLENIIDRDNTISYGNREGQFLTEADSLQEKYFYFDNEGYNNPALDNILTYNKLEGVEGFKYIYHPITSYVWRDPSRFSIYTENIENILYTDKVEITSTNSEYSQKLTQKQGFYQNRNQSVEEINIRFKKPENILKLQVDGFTENTNNNYRVEVKYLKNGQWFDFNNDLLKDKRNTAEADQIVKAIFEQAPERLIPVGDVMKNFHIYDKVINASNYKSIYKGTENPVSNINGGANGKGNGIMPVPGYEKVGEITINPKKQYDIDLPANGTYIIKQKPGTGEHNFYLFHGQGNELNKDTFTSVLKTRTDKRLGTKEISEGLSNKRIKYILNGDVDYIEEQPREVGEINLYGPYLSRDNGLQGNPTTITLRPNETVVFNGKYSLYDGTPEDLNLDNLQDFGRWSNGLNYPRNSEVDSYSLYYSEVGAGNNFSNFKKTFAGFKNETNSEKTYRVVVEDINGGDNGPNIIYKIYSANAKLPRNISKWEELNKYIKGGDNEIALSFDNGYISKRNLNGNFDFNVFEKSNTFELRTNNENNELLSDVYTSKNPIKENNNKLTELFINKDTTLSFRKYRINNAINSNRNLIESFEFNERDNVDHAIGEISTLGYLGYSEGNLNDSNNPPRKTITGSNRELVFNNYGEVFNEGIVLNTETTLTMRGKFNKTRPDGDYWSNIGLQFSPSAGGGWDRDRTFIIESHSSNNGVYVGQFHFGRDTTPRVASCGTPEGSLNGGYQELTYVVNNNHGAGYIKVYQNGIETNHCNIPNEFRGLPLKYYNDSSLRFGGGIHNMLGGGTLDYFKFYGAALNSNEVLELYKQRNENAIQNIANQDDSSLLCLDFQTNEGINRTLCYNNALNNKKNISEQYFNDARIINYGNNTLDRNIFNDFASVYGSGIIPEKIVSVSSASLLRNNSTLYSDIIIKKYTPENADIEYIPNQNLHTPNTPLSHDLLVGEVDIKKYKKVRYIRNSINGSNQNCNNHWHEIEAIEADTKRNVAINKNVSLVGGGQLHYGANTVNNSLTEGPNGGYSHTECGNKTIQVDLGSVHNIEEIRVYHHFLDRRVYRENVISVSENGNDWIEVFNSEIEGRYVETAEGKRVQLSTIPNLNGDNVEGLRILSTSGEKSFIKDEVREGSKDNDSTFELTTLFLKDGRPNNLLTGINSFDDLKRVIGTHTSKPVLNINPGSQIFKRGFNFWDNDPDTHNISWEGNDIVLTHKNGQNFYAGGYFMLNDYLKNSTNFVVEGESYLTHRDWGAVVIGNSNILIDYNGVRVGFRGPEVYFNALEPGRWNKFRIEVSKDTQTAKNLLVKLYSNDVFLGEHRYPTNNDTFRFDRIGFVSSYHVNTGSVRYRNMKVIDRSADYLKENFYSVNSYVSDKNIINYTNGEQTQNNSIIIGKNNFINKGEKGVGKIRYIRDWTEGNGRIENLRIINQNNQEINTNNLNVNVITNGQLNGRQIDLGSELDIKEITLEHHGNYSYIKTEVSRDGKKWYVLYDTTIDNYRTPKEQTYQVSEARYFKGENNFKYLKIKTNGNNRNEGNHYYEVELFDKNNNNFLLGNGNNYRMTFNGNELNNEQKTILTDGKYIADFYASYVDLAINKNEFILELPEITNVSKIGLKLYYPDGGEGRHYKEKEILVSQDGENWYTIFDYRTSGDQNSIEEGYTYPTLYSEKKMKVGLSGVLLVNESPDYYNFSAKRSGCVSGFTFPNFANPNIVGDSCDFNFRFKAGLNNIEFISVENSDNNKKYAGLYKNATLNNYNNYIGETEKEILSYSNLEVKNENVEQFETFDSANNEVIIDGGKLEVGGANKTQKYISAITYDKAYNESKNPSITIANDFKTHYKGETHKIVEYGNAAPSKVVNVRYIRDWSSGTVEDRTLNTWVEIMALEKGTKINRALGKPVTSNKSVNRLEKITDGSIYDAHNDAYGNTGDNTYVQVDLGSVYNIEEIKVWHYYRNETRTVLGNRTEVSEDGIVWTNLSEGKIDGVASTSEGLSYNLSGLVHGVDKLSNYGTVKSEGSNISPDYTYVRNLKTAHGTHEGMLANFTGGQWLGGSTNPFGWNVGHSSGTARIDQAETRNGKPTLRVDMNPGAIVEMKNCSSTSYFGQHGCEMKPNTLYRFSGYVKANTTGDSSCGIALSLLTSNKDGHPSRLGIDGRDTDQEIGSPSFVGFMKGNHDWTRLEGYYKTNQDVKTGHIEFRSYGHCGGGNLGGTMWLDLDSVILEEMPDGYNENVNSDYYGKPLTVDLREAVGFNKGDALEAIVRFDGKPQEFNLKFYDTNDQNYDMFFGIDSKNLTMNAYNRYIRKDTKGSTANGGTHAVEVQAINKDNQNIALNKIVKSGQYHTRWVQNPLEWLVDGVINDPHRYVEPAFYTDNVNAYTNLYVDTYKADKWNKIKLWNYYGNDRRYTQKLYTSKDGIMWNKIFDSDIQGAYPENTDGSGKEFVISTEANGNSIKNIGDVKNIHSGNIYRLLIPINGTALEGKDIKQISFEAKGTNIEIGDVSVLRNYENKFGNNFKLTFDVDITEHTNNKDIIFGITTNSDDINKQGYKVEFAKNSISTALYKNGEILKSVNTEDSVLKDGIKKYTMLFAKKGNRLYVSSKYKYYDNATKTIKTKITNIIDVEDNSPLDLSKARLYFASNNNGYKVSNIKVDRAEDKSTYSHVKIDGNFPQGGPASIIIKNDLGNVSKVDFLLRSGSGEQYVSIKDVLAYQSIVTDISIALNTTAEAQERYIKSIELARETDLPNIITSNIDTELLGSVIIKKDSKVYQTFVNNKEFLMGSKFTFSKVKTGPQVEGITLKLFEANDDGTIKKDGTGENILIAEKTLQTNAVETYPKKTDLKITFAPVALTKGKQYVFELSTNNETGLYVYGTQTQNKFTQGFAYNLLKENIFKEAFEFNEIGNKVVGEKGTIGFLGTELNPLDNHPTREVISGDNMKVVADINSYPDEQTITIPDGGSSGNDLDLFYEGTFIVKGKIPTGSGQNWGAIFEKQSGSAYNRNYGMYVDKYRVNSIHFSVGFEGNKGEGIVTSEGLLDLSKDDTTIAVSINTRTGKYKIYQDGVFKEELNMRNEHRGLTLFASNYPLIIFKQLNGFSSNPELDYIRIYDKELSASQINALYKNEGGFNNYRVPYDIGMNLITKDNDLESLEERTYDVGVGLIKEVDGDLILEGYDAGDGVKRLLIKGNSTFRVKGNIIVNADEVLIINDNTKTGVDAISYVGFITDNDIIIGPNTKILQGGYFARGSVKTELSNEQLYVYGLLSGNEVDLQNRTYIKPGETCTTENNKACSVVLEFDKRLYKRMPPLFYQSNNKDGFEIKEE